MYAKFKNSCHLDNLIFIDYVYFYRLHIFIDYAFPFLIYTTKTSGFDIDLNL